MNEIVGGINEDKIHHERLILEGVCSGCAHCGQPLTDAVSIERGIGPICSKKGYLEEAHFNTGEDPTDAMIYVAAWPELFKFLTERAGSKDPRRGLMNGLVRVCSLNRKNKNLVKCCCDAVEALGWKRLANALRESCTIVNIKVSKDNPALWELRVVRAHFNFEFVRALRNIPGQRYERYPNAHNLIPKSQKAAIWKALVTYYPGECGKGECGGFKIPETLEE